MSDSPTREGGEDGARERAEVLDAEAQLDAPQPATDEPVAAPDPEPVRAEPEPTEADRRLAVLEARSTPPRDAETGRFVPRDEGENDQPNDTGVEAEAPAEVAPEDPAEPEPAPEPELPPGTRRGEDGQWYVDLQVDGATQSIPYAQYHANAQKYLTGDRRLQEAALAKKQLEALRAPQSDQLPQGAGVAPPQGGQQSVTREMLQKAVLEGDEQAEAALLARINREPQSIDPSAIASVAAMQAREQIEVDTAIAQVSADPVNAMILSDDVMRDVADRFSASLRDSEPHLRPAENIARALEMTREHVSRYAPAPAQQPPAETVSLQQRTAAKAAQARVTAPVGGQARQPLAPPVPAAPSPKSIREQMRLGRAS